MNNQMPYGFIPPFFNEQNEIKQLKNKGYKVLAYLSVGTIEKERNWFNTYSKYKSSIIYFFISIF